MIAAFKRSVNSVKTELAGQGVKSAEFYVETLGDEGYVTNLTRAKFEEVVFTPGFVGKLLGPLNEVIQQF